MLLLCLAERVARLRSRSGGRRQLETVRQGAPRHVKRPVEGQGGPAPETVKQMATEMHRRWPRFTHALPLFLRLPPSFALLLLCTISRSLSHFFYSFFLSMLGSASAPVVTSDFVLWTFVGFFFSLFFFIFIFLSLSLSLPD